MSAMQELPEGYHALLSIDLQKDKKSALLVNGIAIVIAAIMIAAVAPFVSIRPLFDLSAGFLPYFFRFLTMLVGLVVYMVLHELVHGVAMKLCGTQKVRYGFTGLYAFAASNDYYDKKSYLFIAMAPVVLWGVVLLILNFFVPASYFWVVYFIQITNISGAAGDFYVTWKFSKLPADIAVQDSGVAMTVYSAN